MGPQGDAWPPPLRAWSVAITLSITYALAYVDRIILSVLAPYLQRDLHLSDTQLGVLGGAAFALTYTLFSAPIGWLVDRTNRLRIIAAGAAVWSVATLGLGAASQYWQLFLGRVMVGAGEASLQPAAASLIADHFPPAARSRAFGVFLAGTSVGTALAYFCGGALLEFHHRRGPFDLPLFGKLRDWQFVFVVLGVAGLLLPIAYLFLREPQRRERDLGQAAQPSLRALQEFILRQWRLYGAHHLAMVLFVAAIYGKTMFMPTFFVRVHEWPALRVGQVFGTVALLAGILGSLTSGWLISHLAGRKVADASWVVMIFGILGTSIPLMLVPILPTGEWAMVAFAFSALFTNWPMVGALTAVNLLTPNEYRGQVMAFYTFCIGLLSAGAGPMLVGWVTDGVFKSPLAVGSSIAWVSGVAAALAVLLLAGTRAQFARFVRPA